MQNQQAIIYARQSHLPLGGKVDQTHVFIYARVAAEDATKLDEQVRGCQTHCQENGFLVVDTFKEFGSGNTLDREQLSLMLTRCKSGEIDAIVVMTPDRLSRNADLYQKLVAALEEHHVEIIEVHE